MPQAIKHYNGYLSGGSDNASIYTCPANTIAIVLPSLVIMSDGSNANVTIGWNSSTSVATDTGNLKFAGVDANKPYLVSHASKYDVMVPVRGNDDSLTYFSPNHTANLTNGFYAFKSLQSTGSNSYQSESAPGFWASNQEGNGDNIKLRWFHTGAWVMSATHKLGINTDSQGSIQYNFLILEEAA